MCNSGLKYKTFRSAFIVGVVILFSVIETNAAQIVDIRTGYHNNFSRIVIQLDVPTEFNFTKDFQNKRVVLEFKQVEVRFRLGGLQVDSDDKFLERIEYDYSITSLKLFTYLKSLDVRLDYYSMSDPYRVVIDVYRARQRKAPVQKVQPELSENFEIISLRNEQPATSENITLDTSSASIIHPYQEDDSTSQAQINSFLQGIFLKESDDTNTSSTSTQIRSTQLTQEIKKWANLSNKNVKKNKLNLLFGIMGAFIVLDIIIFAYYALRRKRKIKKSESGQNNPSSMAPKTTQKNFKTALNDTIQEKMSETKSSLIRASHSNVIQDSLISSKIESLIESLSESMNSPEPILREFPDLEEIAKDLKKISPNEKMSTELLIGKDGAEFIKNLDRHS